MASLGWKWEKENQIPHRYRGNNFQGVWKPAEEKKEQEEKRWGATCGSVPLDCSYHLQWHYTIRRVFCMYILESDKSGKPTHWHMIQVRGGTQKLDCLVPILAVQFILSICPFYSPYGEAEEHVYANLRVRIIYYSSPRGKPKRETMRSKDIILLGHGISCSICIKIKWALRRLLYYLREWELWWRQSYR